MRSMDDMQGVEMGGGDDSESQAPVTRAEFEALKAQVADLASKVDEDEQDDQNEDSDSPMTSSSIAGANKSVKPSPMAKKLVGGMFSGVKGGSKPPFSS